MSSNENYKYKYVEREEINKIEYIIKDDNVKSIFINGKSGVGKTTLVKNMFQRNNHLNNQVVYFDAFEQIENIKNKLIETFTLICLLSENNSVNMNIMNLDKENTLGFYIENINKDKTIKNIFFTLLNLTAKLSSIPIDISKFPEINNVEYTKIIEEFEISKLINEYLTKTFVEKPLYVVIDNIQELSQKNIQQLKNIFSNSNCKFIQIYRELENEYLIEDEIYNYIISLPKDNIEIIEIPKYNYKIVEKLLETNIKEYKNLLESQRKELINQIIEKSDYNAYEIKNLISQYNRDSNNGILNSISNTIYNLDVISKQILYLISKLKKGIRKKILEKVFDLEYGNPPHFNLAIKNLLDQQFISYENYNKGIIKFEHEKILSKMAELSNENLEEISTINETLIDVLIKDSYENEEYFLNNINSILLLSNLNDLGKDLYLIFRYIDFLYENCLYSEIVDIYTNKISNCFKIVHFFPIKTIITILDSLQKNGEFLKGIKLVQELSEYTNLGLFKAKYLIQQYKYDEAFEILKNYSENNEATAIYINCLLHLRHDEEAQSLTNRFLKKNSKDLYYYLILRNTFHLYKYDLALKHLKICENYFFNQKFYLATSKNNLGIVYLYEKKYTTAKRCFESSRDIFNELKSVEVYQSYFNLSTYYILTQNYKSAKELIETGFNTVPENLKYDIFKFKNNLFIIEYLLKNDNDKYELYEKINTLFLEVLNDDNNIPDPNLKYLLAYNLNSIKPQEYTSKIIDQYNGRKGIYNVNFKINDMDILLSISPHWRF